MTSSLYSKIFPPGRAMCSWSRRLPQQAAFFIDRYVKKLEAVQSLPWVELVGTYYNRCRGHHRTYILRFNNWRRRFSNRFQILNLERANLVLLLSCGFNNNNYVPFTLLHIYRTIFSNFFDTSVARFFSPGYAFFWARVPENYLKHFYFNLFQVPCYLLSPVFLFLYTAVFSFWIILL